MAQLTVRNLENSVKEAIKRRARRHGRSMEDEVRHILRNAAKDVRPPVRDLGSRIAAHFKGIGLREDLPELRGHPVRPADFDVDHS